MQIIEIYKSLQRESSYAGLPCIFVRLAGCNLRCVWCDSEYTFTGGKRMRLDDIEQEVHRLLPDGGLVEITGGEPLLQEREAVPLMDRLLGAGYTVLLETSGEQPLERVPPQVVKIVDVKCPDSGEADTFNLENLKWLGPRDEVKFVIGSRGDYEWSVARMAEHQLARRCGAVLFSPVFGRIEPRLIVEWMLADKVEARFQLQMHKFIWDPKAKGV